MGGGEGSQTLILENSYSDLLVEGCDWMAGTGDMEKGTRCKSLRCALSATGVLWLRLMMLDPASGTRDSSFRCCGER